MPFVVLGKGVTATRTHDIEVVPALAEVLLDETAYVTMNRFHGPRNGSKLAQLIALYLDLDVHGRPGSNRPQEEWAEQLYSDLARMGLPKSPRF